MSMSGRRSSPATREGERYCGRSHRKYSDLKIEVVRPRSLVQSHVSM